MVGAAQYLDSEIHFVLELVVDKKKPPEIRQRFEARFGKPLNNNQVRYIKNKYGKDPRFNSPLVNAGARLPASDSADNLHAAEESTPQYRAREQSRVGMMTGSRTSFSQSGHIPPLGSIHATITPPRMNNWNTNARMEMPDGLETSSTPFSSLPAPSRWTANNGNSLNLGRYRSSPMNPSFSQQQRHHQSLQAVEPRLEVDSQHQTSLHHSAHRTRAPHDVSAAYNDTAQHYASRGATQGHGNHYTARSSNGADQEYGNDFWYINPTDDLNSLLTLSQRQVVREPEPSSQLQQTLQPFPDLSVFGNPQALLTSPESFQQQPQACPPLLETPITWPISTPADAFSLDQQNPAATPSFPLQQQFDFPGSNGDWNGNPWPSYDQAHMQHAIATAASPQLYTPPPLVTVPQAFPGNLADISKTGVTAYNVSAVRKVLKQEGSSMEDIEHRLRSSNLPRVEAAAEHDSTDDFTAFCHLTPDSSALPTSPQPSPSTKSSSAMAEEQQSSIEVNCLSSGQIPQDNANPPDAVGTDPLGNLGDAGGETSISAGGKDSFADFDTHFLPGQD